MVKSQGITAIWRLHIWRRPWVVVWIFCAALLSVLVLLRNDWIAPGNVAPVSTAQKTTAFAPPKFITPIESLEERPMTPSKKADGKNISPAQQIIIQKSLDAAFGALKEVEKNNKVITYEKASDINHSIIVRIDKPTQSQLGSIRTQITDGLAQLPADSPAWKQLYAKGEKFIQENVVYPKATKMLDVSARLDGAFYTLLEINVDDDSLVKPDASGVYNVPLPPVGILREDPDFGAPNSWGTKRYGHLFSIQEKVEAGSARH